MITPEYVQQKPKLKEASLIPSLDYPDEFILVCKENGAALGITEIEKRLLEKINGEQTWGQILEEIIEERLAPLSALRKLTWDLHRYGFLHVTPFPAETLFEGWGYVGSRTFKGKMMIFPAVWKSLDSSLGNLLISPGFHILTLVLLIFGCWCNWEIGMHVEPLVISGSPAKALLVVLLSMAGSVILSFLFGIAVLRKANDKIPVRLFSDLRLPVPLLRLDGRRLQCMYARRAFHYAVSPWIGLLFISTLMILLSGLFHGLYGEWFFHIAAAAGSTVFLSALPWNSSLLSREVVYRLRKKTVLSTFFQSLRQVFFFFLYTRWPNRHQERLLLYWGGWGVCSSLILLKGISLAIRWGLPAVTIRLFQEDSSLVMISLFILCCFLAIVFLTAIISFFIWLCQSLFREIHLRFWPQKDKMIAAVLTAVILILSLLNGSDPVSELPWNWLFIVLFSVVFILMAGYAWIKGGMSRVPSIYGLLIVSVLYFQCSISFPCDFQSNTLWGLGIFVLLSDILYFAIAYKAGWLLLNTPVITVLAGNFILLTGCLNHAAYEDSYINYLLMVWGFAVINAGVVLRYALYKKAALGYLGKHVFPLALDDEYLVPNLLIQRLKEIFKIRQIKAPASSSQESLETFINQLKRQFGNEMVYAAWLNCLRSLPWTTARDLAGFFPRMVKSFALKQWDKHAIIELLNRVPVFSVMQRMEKEEGGGEISRLSNRVRFTVFEPGDRLIQQGEESGELFIIAEGNVAVIAEGVFGKQVIVTLGAGDFVGEIGFLAGGKRTATVQSLVPTLALCVHRRDVDSTMPRLFEILQKAKTGETWLQTVRQIPVLEEFSPGLRARVCLDSYPVEIESQVILSLEKPEYDHVIGVVVQGKGRYRYQEDERMLASGSYIGLRELFLGASMRGCLQSDEHLLLMWIDRQLFLDAAGELITPVELLE